ncbi:MAG: hypothetical protein L6Q99_12365 [Planctomycetes bacterium]|nr:hypothetical protein [Planctomycetota bacterium]
MPRSSVILLLGCIALDACACVALDAGASSNAEDGVQRSFTLAVGPAQLGSEGWADYDDRPQLELGYAAVKPDAPVGFELSLQGGRSEAHDDPRETSADFVEGRFGVRREVEFLERLQFVVGGGPRLAFTTVNLVGTYAPTSDNGASFGAYVHAGLFCRVTGNFSIGVDAQAADGSDYSVADRDRDARLTMLMVALRWDF